MKTLVTGGTGFIGTYLVPRLVEAGHEPVLLARRTALGRVAALPGVRVIEADLMRPGPWWRTIDDCEAAINLCGEPIHGRWNEAKKSRIRESRLRPLAHLIAAIPQDRPFKLLSASAVGYYGDAGERVLNETAPPGRDFLARMARDWETQALTAEGGRTRVALMRFGMVLGVGGGALEELIKALQRRVGAVIGRGRQWVSWIHQEDVARAVLFLLENDRLDGPFNLASPEPRRQGDVVRSLASQLGCRVGLPTPARAVRVATGGFADALLASQRMNPEALLAAGFEFRYSDLDEAFAEILSRRGRPAV
jgi:uncharacterized protein (TIGR01777 family)